MAYIKGTVARDFRPPYFPIKTNTPGPLIHSLKYFRIRVRIRRDIRIRSLTDRYIFSGKSKKTFRLGEFWNMDVIGLG